MLPLDRALLLEHLGLEGTCDRIPMLTLGSDGMLTGSTPVNRMFGPYSIEGGRLMTGNLATTMMAGPEAEMGLEARTLALLGASPTVVEVDAGWELRADDRVALAVVAPRAIGSVVYRQRIALPDDAVTTVTVSDVSRADAPAIGVGEQRIDGGQVPIAFDVAFHAGPHVVAIAVSARIECDGRLLWISDTVHEVPAEGADGLVINVIQVQH